MEYRNWNNKPLRTSLLGYGCMRFPTRADGSIDEPRAEALLNTAKAAGVNYFDTAYPYHNGQSEPFVGRVIAKWERSSFYLATKMPLWTCKSLADAQRIFEEQLQRLGVKYIDFYLLHNMGGARTAKFDEYGMWEWAAQKKAEGIIKHLGFSMHDNAETLDKLLTDHPDMDFVQLQVNYLDWEDPVVESRKCMEVAQKHGVPVVIMEPARGGRLADLPERGASVLKAADPDKSVVSWAYRFCYNLPNVISVLSGVSTLKQIQENVREWKANEPFNASEEKALGDAVDALKSVGLIPCTNCRYCVKDCPAGVKIPEALGLLNLEKMTENREFAKSQYAWQTRDGRAYAYVDTVGFVRRLPTQLVEAFKSTLEEVAEADVILHVVDGSHPDPFSQVDAVNDVLADIEGTASIPRILVFNKADQADEATRERLAALQPDAFIVSAYTGEGLDELRTAVESLLPVPHVHVNALLPYTAGSLISRVREYGKVDKVEYRDDGIQLEADVDAHLAAQVVEQSID